MNVVFDFGAVLFTWRPVELVAQCFPARAVTPLQAGYLAHAVFGHGDWHDFDRGTLSMDTVVQRTSIRLDLDPTALAALVESIGERLAPIPETVALLAQLRAQRASTTATSDVRLYFLSNMPVPYARALERMHPFLQWFDGGIFSGDVHHIKPEPAIYQLLQTRYALDPAQTVFIDDLLGNVQAAQALGWHGIHFESAHQLCTPLERWMGQAHRGH
jgi:putative hydrolase of the HAD superfamily